MHENLVIGGDSVKKILDQDPHLLLIAGVQSALTQLRVRHQERMEGFYVATAGDDASKRSQSSLSHEK